MKYLSLLLLICNLAHAEWGESPGRGCIHPKPRQCVDCVEHAVAVDVPQSRPVCQQCIAPRAEPVHATVQTVVNAEAVNLDTKAFMREHSLTVPPIMLDVRGQKITQPSVVVAVPLRIEKLLPHEMPIFSAYEKEVARIPDAHEALPKHVFMSPLKTVVAEIIEDKPAGPTPEQALLMREYGLSVPPVILKSSTPYCPECQLRR